MNTWTSDSANDVPPWLRSGELYRPADLTPKEYDNLRFWIATHHPGHRTEDDWPILLNEGTPYEEPFGITRALEWAERLAG